MAEGEVALPERIGRIAPGQLGDGQPCPEGAQGAGGVALGGEQIGDAVVAHRHVAAPRRVGGSWPAGPGRCQAGPIDGQGAGSVAPGC